MSTVQAKFAATETAFHVEGYEKSSLVSFCERGFRCKKQN